MASFAEPLSTPPGSSHEARPSLLARYRTLADVRRAIDTLEARGVDGDHLALVGQPGHLPGGTDRRRADSRILSHTMAFLALGVLGGALVGAALGTLVVGPVVLLWPGLEASGWVFALIIVWFAAGGAVLGCFIAISRVVGFSESWALTFEDEPEGPLWLAVYEPVADPDELGARTDALEVVPDPPVDLTVER